MIYSEFNGNKLSMLGFGAMRFPTLEDGAIDEKQTAEMIEYAYENGVNYFDTAYPYHGGMSEVVLGKILRRYPRDSFFLATKYPGHQISSTYDPSAIFEEQLKKCGVEYFDFYLLHNVSESSVSTFLDPRWDIIGYLREQKRNGRIRHLGFSTHARPECLVKFLDTAGEDMEFCQIQLNWLDWTLQDAKSKVELLNSRNIPIWVMEPVRGGKLCTLDEKYAEQLRAMRPDESGTPAWCFRFLQGIPGVKVILSGMSNMGQVRDNIATFAQYRPLDEKENSTLLSIAERMIKTVPCTGCRYCTDSCPMELDIPLMMSICSELRFAKSINISMRIEALPGDKRPSSCIGCGACAQMCPQNIDIPAVMEELNSEIEKLPKWSEICRQREEAARKLHSGI